MPFEQKQLLQLGDSGVRQSDWLFLPAQDTVDTPVGNNGLPQMPLWKQVPQLLKTKVCGKRVCKVRFEKHMPRLAKVYPWETWPTLSLEAYSNWRKNGLFGVNNCLNGMLTDGKTAYYRPTGRGHWGETITDCATNCTLQHASKRDIVLILFYVCMGRASCLVL